jgi:hypothetical protein
MPEPSAIRGFVLASSSASSSPVTCSFEESHRIASDGLLFDTSVGSRSVVRTPSIVKTRLEIVSSQDSHVFHSPA